MNRTVLAIITTLSLFLTGLSVQAQSVGGFTSGATSWCSGNNSGFVSLNGHTGSILHWESSTDQVVWTNLGNPTVTQSYLNLTQTTYYRAIVQDGAFPPDTSTATTITIFVPAAGGQVVGGGAFCVGTGAGTLTLSNSIGNVLYWQVSTDGGSTWTQIANTTNSLNYTNITQNTLYNAVVENVAGCPIDTATEASFTIDPASNAGTLASSATECLGINEDTITLTNTEGNVMGWNSSTDGGATWVSIGFTGNSLPYLNLTQSISYQVIAQSGVCPPDSSNVVTITVVPPSPVTTGPDQDIILHQSTVITSTGNGTISWSPSNSLDDPNTFNPTATPANTTMYIATLTDANGCTDSDTVIVSVDIPIPSAISPNGDGVNDFFLIDNVENLTDNSLSIFSRHGQAVFEASPYRNTWQGQGKNGQDLPDGIYYYVLQPGGGNPPLDGFVLIKR